MNLIALLLSLMILFAATCSASPRTRTAMIGSVVKSEKWNIRRKPHKIEELSGNVTYRKEGRFLRADWALYDHRLKVLKAKGRIRAEHPADEGDKILFRGEIARFDEKLQKGLLRGKNKSDSVHFERVHATLGSTGNGRAQVLRFDAAQKSFRLEGRRPYVTGREARWSTAVQADRITVYEGGAENRRIVAQGRTQGWIYFPYDKSRLK